jgi:DNA repair photolyase
VRVKINAPEVFEADLRRRFGQPDTLESFGIDTGPADIFRPTVFFSSGVSDAYQPIEKEYGLTRKLLETTRDYGLPIHVMTKSATVLRDLDLLREIADTSNCTVSFSIPSSDGAFASLFEPGSSNPSERFEAMKELHRAGIRTGLCLMPIVPFFSDSEDSINETLRQARNAGAGHVLFGAMTLRDEQQEHFYSVLGKSRPEEAGRLKRLYRGEYAPPHCYQKEISRRVIRGARKLGLPVHLDRYLPEHRFMETRKAATILFQLAYFHEITGGRNYTSSNLVKVAREIENLRTDFHEAMDNGVVNTLENMNRVSYSLLEEYAGNGKVAELEGFRSGSLLDEFLELTPNCKTVIPD